MDQALWRAGLLSSESLLYAGVGGLIAGFLLLAVFIYRRILWLLRSQVKDKGRRPTLGHSIRNLVLILTLSLSSGIVLFGSFFIRAWRVFNTEQAVAEIRVFPGSAPQTSRVAFTEIEGKKRAATRTFLLRGDQWMVEGDILKWRPVVNFLGLHTRFRLTRLRGRYLTVADELAKPASVYSLTERENDPLWRWLYRYAPRLPVVSTVYGNAAYQFADREQSFMLFVGTSGFIVRESPAAGPRGLTSR